MPTSPIRTAAAECDVPADAHNGLTCADVEALLGDAHAQIEALHRQLENTRAEKHVAVCEAVELRTVAYTTT